MRSAACLGGVVTAAVALGSARPALAQDRAACLASYDAGQAARDDKKLVEARRHFAICASDACSPALRTDCIEWLRGVDELIPSAVVRVTDASGRDLPHATVTIDGVRVAGPLDGKPQLLDPGTHVVRASVPGAPPAEERIVAAQGEKGRVVVLKLLQPASAPAPEAAPRPKAGLGPAFLAAVGVGALAAGVATYFYVKGTGDGDDLRASCGSPPSCSRADVDAVHSKLLVGDVFLGVSLVSLGVAAVLLVNHASAPSARASWLRPSGVAFRF